MAKKKKENIQKVMEEMGLVYVAPKGFDHQLHQKRYKWLLTQFGSVCAELEAQHQVDSLEWLSFHTFCLINDSLEKIIQEQKTTRH